MSRLSTDDRGVSVTVSYALNLVVATLLVAVLLTATGNVVEDRRESSARTELSVVGNRLAAELSAADRLASVGGADATVRLDADLPGRVAGATYRIEVNTGGSDPHLLLSTGVPEVSVRVPVRTSTPVEPTEIGGGDLVVSLSGGQLEVERA